MKIAIVLAVILAASVCFGDEPMLDNRGTPLQTGPSDPSFSHPGDLLYEHECYEIQEAIGAEAAPASRLIPIGQRPTAADLDHLTGDKVVLKVVSPDITHKTEAKGVRRSWPIQATRSRRISAGVMGSCLRALTVLSDATTTTSSSPSPQTQLNVGSPLARIAVSHADGCPSTTRP